MRSQQGRQQPDKTNTAPVPSEAITVKCAGTLAGLFHERVRRSPDAPAYLYYDVVSSAWLNCTWEEMAREVARWQAALEKESLQKGDRIAIMVRNSRQWVMLDQAALALDLITVPLYTEDRADNVDYILADADVKLLVIGGGNQWERIKSRADRFTTVNRIVSILKIDNAQDKRIVHQNDWLPKNGGEHRILVDDPDALATIVYTSGTTGNPKGVMLSHRNILSNAYSGLSSVIVTTEDVFLSFLPLSHMFERTVGYYLPMMAGAKVAYSRGITELAKDLTTINPTGLITVPRVFERVYAKVNEQLQDKPVLQRKLFELAVNVGWDRFEYRQGRASLRPSIILWPLLKWLVADKFNKRLSKNLKIAISGGAALAPEISRVFIGLGMPILQGYGLTEASPVVSVNRLDNNIPASIGPALKGVEVKIRQDEELLVRGDLVMLGYWNNPEATTEAIDGDGWLHTGDKASMEGDFIFITGRLKEIIVLTNGEKIPPGDMELAIAVDTLIDQIMVIGEAQPYLTALAVLNEEQWNRYANRNKLEYESLTDESVEKVLLNRISKHLSRFPGYAQIRRVTCTIEPWSVDNGLLTPTLKIKRNRLKEKYAEEIAKMYSGHSI